MEYTILKQFDVVSDYVNQVSSIADRNKEAFGFLSASAYEQMASKGQLWIAVNDNKELKGYLMFGGTMPTLKIFQVYVCKSVKGKGIGKLLLNNLKDHARSKYYHTISARVASDLPANNFWEKNGFIIHRQVKGGETTKRIINIRGYSLEDNDLFGGLAKDTFGPTPSSPMLSRPIYALDVNLLLDIYKARQGYNKVIKLMKIGLQGGFSICITPEFKKELERQTMNFVDDPVLRLAEMFPELKVENDISTIAIALREIVFPCRSSTRKFIQNDESDLMHLAYCISAGVGAFVTREKALLRASGDIRVQYNISILSPDELILDDGDILEISKPLSADFTLESSSNTQEIRNFLRDYSPPDIINTKLFSNSPIGDNSLIYEARFDGSLFGVYFFQKPTKNTGFALACLYIDENSPKAIAAIDHFLEKTMRYRSGFSYRINLYIGQDQYLTKETLIKKGFIKLEDHYVKIMCNIFLHNKNWNGFSNEIKSLCGFSIPNKLPTKKELLNTGICLTDSTGKVLTLSWFDFETMISPRFIFNSDRSCTLVPIRENYANGLLGNLTNQLSLLDSHDKALLLEKAYFRSCSKASLFKKGELIAFYVSGSKSVQEIIGIARITYSELISIDEAVIKVDRQGVLSRQELCKIANKYGKIHAFTFDNFLEVDRRISFGSAKQLKLISNANLVSPEKIGSDKLNILIREAFYE
jgi:GNAT superfamily N-acetyltransferase/predicted nucleic acid-binding protein